MTPDEEREWQQRLRAALEQTIRRRQQRAAERAQLDARRAHGLKRRHAARVDYQRRPTHRGRR